MSTTSLPVISPVLTALRALHDEIPDLVFYRDIKGVYLGCNSAFYAFAGHACEANIIGLTNYDLFDQETADFFRQQDLAVLSKGSASFEWVFQQSDGSPFFAAVNLTRMEVAENVFLHCVLRDISERKKIEQALQESEEKYRCLFDLSEDAMWLTIDNRFVMANQASAQLLGYDSSDTLIGLHPSKISPEFQPDGQPSDKKANFMMAIAYREGYHRFEWSHKKRNGKVFPLDISLTRVPYEGHEALFCIARDITERKQLESLEKCRSHVMEIIATEDVFTDIMRGICLSVEQQYPDILCSILLLDDEGKHILMGAAPSLPDIYNTAIHGLPIGPSAGSCGTAAFTGQRVIVADIQTHPYWSSYKELASAAGLAACWSEPIRSSEGKILGTFAIYHQSPHHPSDADSQLIEQTAHLASIAIEKHQTKLALQSIEQRWAFAIEGSDDGVWDWDIQTDKTIYSQRWKEMLGYSEDEVPTNNQQWLERIYPKDREKVYQTIHACLDGKLPKYLIKYRLDCKETGYKWILDRGMVVSQNSAGKPLRIVGTHSDISKSKQDEDKLKLAASVFSHASEGIMITDSKGSIIEINDTFTKLTGYSRDQVMGKNFSMFKSGRQPLAYYIEMWGTLRRTGAWSGESWYQRKNGARYAASVTISAVHDSTGKGMNYVAFFTDITQKKNQQKQLERMAHYDVLTGLPNRVLLTDRLNQAMSHAKRNAKSVAVLFLDLDGFKKVNDTFGHYFGDELLISVSKQLKKSLREEDTLSRISGDEFIAVLTDADKIQDYEPVLKRLLEAASMPFTVANSEVVISASIGVTIYPQDDSDADVLIRHADQAMYTAKQQGKNRYHLFDTVQDIAVKNLGEDLKSIRSALEKREFVLFYQPKVNMKSGAVIGAEALIRWQHPVRGLVPPNDFLPIIENHPLSIDIGEWVIDTALSQMASWKALGLDVPVSVNISAFQLQKEGFSERLSALLAAHPEVPASCLEIEVLETSEIEDVTKISEIMSTCIALGVQFSLDDFGTGYSSLTYIRRLPAQTVKIDQSFIRDMLDDPDDLAIINGVIGLAKSFNREVIAEGVETIAHGSALLQLGCDLAQGYGIARPMPVQDIPAWIETWHPDKAWLAKPNRNL